MGASPDDTGLAEFREASMEAGVMQAQHADERAARADQREGQAKAEAEAAPTESARETHLREAAVHAQAAERQRVAARLQRNHVAEQSAARHES